MFITKWKQSQTCTITSGPEPFPDMTILFKSQSKMNKAFTENSMRTRPSLRSFLYITSCNSRDQGKHK